MSRISEIRIKQTLPSYIVSIRKTINFMEEYSKFFVETMSLVSTYLDEQGVFTSSPSMVCFHNMDFEQLKIRCYFDEIYSRNRVDNSINNLFLILQTWKN